MLKFSQVREEMIMQKCHYCDDRATFVVRNHSGNATGACQTHLRRVIEILITHPDQVVTVAKRREPAHVDYPHHPGTLYDCPACEASGELDPQ